MSNSGSGTDLNFDCGSASFRDVSFTLGDGPRKLTTVRGIEDICEGSFSSLEFSSFGVHGPLGIGNVDPAKLHLLVVESDIWLQTVMCD